MTRIMLEIHTFQKLKKPAFLQAFKDEEHFTWGKMNTSHKDNTNKQQENQTKIQRLNKWTRLVLDWPGHLIFNSHREADGIRAALKAAGYIAQSGKLRDGRIKIWRVAK